MSSVAHDGTDAADVAVDDVFGCARRSLDRERRHLEAERDAFDRFVHRIESLPTTEARPDTPALLTRDDRAGLARVRETYAETVMDVPHYGEVYDDPFAESVAEEFGAELAAAVTNGSGLHPSLRRSLAEAGRHAVRDRERLLETVRREREDVDRADRVLAAVADDLASLLDQPIGRLEENALRLTQDRLEELRRRCDDLAVTRQEHLRCRTLVGVDADDLGRYLYDACGTAHPVLSAIATVGDAIARAHGRIDRRRSLVTASWG